MDRLMINYLPEVIKGIREYKAIMTVEQPEFEGGWAQAEYALQESILISATEYGLSRWEAMIGISPKATETLDERRFRIISLISSDMPYTYRQLEALLANLCGDAGYEIDLDHGNYSILVKVALTARNNYEATQELLEKILPANLILSMTLMYNQHVHFTGMTHADMAAYTHHGIRNEVF